MQKVHGSGAPARAFAWVTDSYYTTKPPSDVHAVRSDEPAPWWQLRMPDFLQNRTRRYYLNVVMVILMASFATTLVANLWQRFGGDARWRRHWLMAVVEAPYNGLAALVHQLRQMRVLR